MTTEELIAAYFAAWNEPEAARRERLLKEIWAEDATYTDPAVHTVGIRELNEHIDRVFARYPGSRVVMTSRLDAHHGVLRFLWKKTLADGTSLPEGIDFGEVSAEGKLRRIVGFFGPLARS